MATSPFDPPAATRCAASPGIPTVNTAPTPSSWLATSLGALFDASQSLTCSRSFRPVRSLWSLEIDHLKWQLAIALQLCLS
jgi:hypothetical protein